MFINLNFTMKKLFSLCLFLIIMTPFSGYSQDATEGIIQDPTFQSLLKEKIKANASLSGNDKYKIQIFNGDLSNSRRVLNDFKKEFKLMDATIIFHTPTYKVWTGFYKNKIDAERALIDVKKKYPSAFIIKPSKN